MNLCLLWIVLLVAFVIVEAATYQLVTIWFAIGALGGIVCAVLGAPIWVQAIVSVAVSAAALLLLRPTTLRKLKRKSEKTNIDSLVGAEVVITEDADAMNGKGKLAGMEWTVRTEDGSKAAAGEITVVKRIEGVKLIVSRKEN